MVRLDHEALRWALAIFRDERANVERRKAMTPEWAAKYRATEDHLKELIRAAERT